MIENKEMIQETVYIRDGQLIAIDVSPVVFLLYKLTEHNNFQCKKFQKLRLKIRNKLKTKLR